MSTFYIPLARTVLIFLPPHSDEEGDRGAFIVQVTLKPACLNSLEHELAFIFAQKDITKAVENTLAAHIARPLPPDLVIRGKGYTLTGSRKKWVYGQSLKLSWGGMLICPCEDKWTFVFDVC